MINNNGIIDNDDGDDDNNILKGREGEGRKSKTSLCGDEVWHDAAV